MYIELVSNGIKHTYVLTVLHISNATSMRHHVPANQMPRLLEDIVYWFPEHHRIDSFTCLYMYLHVCLDLFTFLNCTQVHPAKSGRGPLLPQPSFEGCWITWPVKMIILDQNGKNFLEISYFSRLDCFDILPLPPF